MTIIHFMVLVLDTAAMTAGLLLGPQAAFAAFLLISAGLGAYTAGAVRAAKT